MKLAANVDLVSTIGTNPWNERTKKQRRVVGSLTTSPAIKRLAGMLDMETSSMVKGLFEASKAGNAVSPHVYQKRLALNVVLMFCYGRRFEDIADPLLHRILGDAKIISRCIDLFLKLPLGRALTYRTYSFRSTNSNAQDYIPYLRSYLFRDETRSSIANEVRGRRDQWLATLLEEVRASVATDGRKNCVASGLITDNQENLTNCKCLNTNPRKEYTKC